MGSAATRLKSTLKYINRNRSPYLYIAPFFISFAVFGLYPMLYSIYLSFCKFKFGQPTVWVGLDNYRAVLADGQFWLSLKNTILLWLGTLPLQLILAFIIASLLNTLASARVRGALSGLYYLPVITNLVAVAMVFNLILDEKFGILNYLLRLIGSQGLPWLTAGQWAKPSTVMLIAWRGTGWYIVFLLAALQGIDRTYYEAAEIDGANAFQRAIYVTLPILSPIFLYLIVMGTISGLQIFTEPYLLFRSASNVVGGPEQSVLTPAMIIFNQGFQYLKFGYASAVAGILGVIITFFSILYFRLFRQD